MDGRVDGEGVLQAANDLAHTKDGGFGGAKKARMHASVSFGARFERRGFRGGASLERGGDGIDIGELLEEGSPGDGRAGTWTRGFADGEFCAECARDGGWRGRAGSCS